MTWKIVADSGCDYRTIENLAVDTLFESVPLTIQVGDEIFIDNDQLNIDEMMEKMYATSSASKSACPSPDDYMKAFDGALNIFVVTPYQEAIIAHKWLKDSISKTILT